MKDFNALIADVLVAIGATIFTLAVLFIIYMQIMLNNFVLPRASKLRIGNSGSRTKRNSSS